jgi:hypothetical protein
MSKPRCCAECGQEFTSIRRWAEFCSPACRSAFNNRRNVRGAQVYDLLMALRYERDEATRLGVWTDLTRLAAHYKLQDERERAGRKSWGDWKSWLRDNPWLQAVVVQQHNAGGKRRA